MKNQNPVCIRRPSAAASAACAVAVEPLYTTPQSTREFAFFPIVSACWSATMPAIDARSSVAFDIPFSDAAGCFFQMRAADGRDDGYRRRRVPQPNGRVEQDGPIAVTMTALLPSQWR